jgi:hypothetical protein
MAATAWARDRSALRSAGGRLLVARLLASLAHEQRQDGLHALGPEAVHAS